MKKIKKYIYFIIILLLIFIPYNFFRKNLIKIIEENNFNIISMYEKNIGISLKYIRNGIDDYFLKNPDYEKLKKILSDTLYAVYDDNGKIVFTNTDEKNFENLIIFKDDKIKKNNYLLSGKYKIILTEHNINENLFISVEFSDAFFKNINISDGKNIMYIIDKNGFIIYSDAQLSYTKKIDEKSNIMKMIKNKYNYFESKNFYGEKVYFFVKKIKFLEEEYYLLSEDKALQYRKTDNIYKTVMSFFIILFVYLVFKIIKITKDNNKNKELIKIENYFNESIINTVDAIIIITNKKEEIIRVNKRFIEITGYSYDEVMGKYITRFFYNYSDLSSEKNSHEVSWITKNKSKLITTISKTYMKDKKENLLNIIYSGVDITQKKEYENLLYYRANYDLMTKCMKREFGINQMKNSIERHYKNKFIIIYIDLNNLKKINDYFGHEEGDKYIRSFCDISREYIKNEDYIIRMGGDEFIMCINNSDINSAVKIVREINESIKKFLKYDNIEIGISSGIVFYDKSVRKNIDELIKEADFKMYNNKMEIKNTKHLL
ncbi:MAG: sensor domain-containing diguanylate cyclase [Thermotogae bacterium]|nr:sensor domain-containing diguanylate cyclase [Thermotogota bacterium]